MTSRILIGAGTFALAATAFAASLFTGAPAPATAESLTGLQGFYIAQEMPGTTLLNLQAGPGTAGTEALLFSGPAPAGATVLFPGTNLVAVPTSPDGTYTAIGPAFGEALVTSGTQWGDHGDH